jgi:hypothetical protein
MLIGVFFAGVLGVLVWHLVSGRRQAMAEPTTAPV